MKLTRRVKGCLKTLIEIGMNLFEPKVGHNYLSQISKSNRAKLRSSKKSFIMCDSIIYLWLVLQFNASPSSGDEIVHFQVNTTPMQVVGFYPSLYNEHICMRVELYGCVPGRLFCC